MPGVSIVGAGIMGRAYMARLLQAGHSVTLHALQDDSRDGPSDLVLLALFDGSESLTALKGMPRHSIVVDLTTQSAADCERNVQLARESGIFYYAGGVTGGSQQARAGVLTVYIGPTPDHATLASLAPLGTIYPQTTATIAVCSKLLHNFVLIIQTQALAAAAILAECAGIYDIGAILDAGTAGRRPSASSVLRDAQGEPTSSYMTRLACKDINAILNSFPGACNIPGLNLAEIAAVWSGATDQPFTYASLKSVRGALETTL